MTNRLLTITALMEEMVVDSTHALEAVSGGSSGGRLTISWLLERRRPHIDATLPKHVARASCLS